ncbi:unnamed protein product [Trifolium pratense]|uniref:Uncharacterized protein n=1 Tax=Trifolium pratense TaxID=57577 RepID=A0ACB0ITI0_TRIPR|nr:unnamed protein product [Trifolium pratense]
MGNCTSFDSSQVESETAKVVVHDGTMKEFSYQVKVSYVLQIYQGCFICDSDEMGYDDVVLAMDEDDVLRLGQLYFALPLNRLKKPLSVVEMAALAVKANSALNESSGGAGGKNRFRRKKKTMFMFTAGDGNRKPGRRVAPENDGGDVAVSVVRSKSNGRRRYSGGGGGRGKYMAALSAIPE